MPRGRKGTRGRGGRKAPRGRKKRISAKDNTSQADTAQATTQESDQDAPNTSEANTEESLTTKFQQNEALLAELQRRQEQIKQQISTPWPSAEKKDAPNLGTGSHVGSGSQAFLKIPTFSPVAPPTQPVREPHRAHTPFQLSILNWNLFQAVEEPLRYTGQSERIARLTEALTQLTPLLSQQHQSVPEATLATPLLPVGSANASLSRGKYDVVVFTEVMYSKAFVSLQKQMYDLGYWYYNQGGIQRASSNLFGGVWIFSRFPITHQDYVVFPDAAYTTDWFAPKGVVYARIAVHVSPNGDWYHVNLLATHLQAWKGDSYDAVRQKQLTYLNQFVCRLQLEPTEPLVLVGDFNMSPEKTQQLLNHTKPGCFFHTEATMWGHYEASENLRAMQWYTLPLSHGSTSKYTWDPSRNSLVGLDNIGAYSQSDPSCVEHYQQLRKCFCCEPALYDQVWIGDRYRKPDVERSYAVVRPVFVQPFSMWYGFYNSQSCNVISDHFPLEVGLVFHDPTQQKKGRT